MSHPAEIFTGRIVAFFDDDDEIIADELLQPIQRAPCAQQSFDRPADLVVDVFDNLPGADVLVFGIGLEPLGRRVLIVLEAKVGEVPSSRSRGRSYSSPDKCAEYRSGSTRQADYRSTQLPAHPAPAPRLWKGLWRAGAGSTMLRFFWTYVRFLNYFLCGLIISAKLEIISSDCRAFNSRFRTRKVIYCHVSVIAFRQ